MNFPLSSALRCWTLVFLALAAPCRAVVDDAHSAAISLAVPAVEKGFVLREDYVKGTVKPGIQKLVKQQLFKGNEVWFWLGVDTENVAIEIEVLDKKGNKVGVDKKITADAAAIRVIPDRTGTYYITFKLTAKSTDDVDWALLYGWRTIAPAAAPEPKK
jgi:hypothetical protein